MAISGMKGLKDNSSRKFSGGGRRPDYNDLKRKEAKERDEKRAALSHKEQLAVLDVRCGKDQGAKRERARLQALIDSVDSSHKNAVLGVSVKVESRPKTDHAFRDFIKNRRDQERAKCPSH